MSDVIVIIADELYGVEVGRREMTDVEINLEVPGHGQRLRKTFGCGELVRILKVGMPVHCNVDLVFLCKRYETLCDGQLSRRGNNVHTECLRRFKSLVELFVRMIVSEVDRVCEKRDAGIVKSLSNGFIMIGGSR